MKTALSGLAVLGIALTTVAVSARYRKVADTSIDRHALEYVDLVAALGVHSPESIDFHTRTRPPGAVPGMRDIALRSRALADHVRDAHTLAPVAPHERDRARTLAAQLDAIASRVDQLSGRHLAFDDELRRLFGVEQPIAPQAPPADIHADLAKRLPGAGALAARLTGYQRRFVVPRGRLHDAVMKSVALCRDRTRRYLTLPDEESIEVEYVTDKPWSGYSIYRGAYRSVLQVNRTLPLSAGDVLNLACHEGYPGHHVYNTLREQHLVRELGRTEATALVLFSPEGFRAEAVVSAAAAMTFSPDERVRIFRDDLFPLIGADAKEAGRYVEIGDLVDRLTATTTPILRRYLAGESDRGVTMQALRDDALMEDPTGLLGYVDRYRGYSFAYTFGRGRFASEFTLADDERHRWSTLQRIVLQQP